LIFRPTDDGIAPIVNIATCQYYEIAVAELLASMRIARENSKWLEYQTLVLRAIRLLILSRIKSNEG